jgi:hypothetical protein
MSPLMITSHKITITYVVDIANLDIQIESYLDNCKPNQYQEELPSYTESNNYFIIGVVVRARKNEESFIQLSR